MKLIAYGSLMCQSSLELTLGRPAALAPLKVPGWKRVFDAPFGGYAFLNLKRAPAARIEAAYFELDHSEVKLFKIREAGSNLVEVIPGYFAFVWPENYCQNLPALKSYIQLCEGGAASLGLNFEIGLEKPVVIVDDLAKPLYT